MSLTTDACTVYDESLLAATTDESALTSDSGGSGGTSTKSKDTTSSTATTAGGSGGSGSTTSSDTETTSTADSVTSGGSGGSGGSDDTVSTSSSAESTTTSDSATSPSSTNSSTTGSGGSGGGSASCEETDCCPDDPDKTEPGDCGCGEPETDTDSDGTADCSDLCPDNPDKVEPGECGCDIPDADSATAAGCVGLKDGLTHRYSFNGTGTTVSDSQGSAHGTVVGTTLDDSGELLLASGDTEQYAELPAGIISALTSVTVEAWFTFSTTSTWQRVFDFGSTEAGVVGEQDVGLTYLFFTPRSAQSGSYPRAIFTHDGFSEEIHCPGSSALQTGTPIHVAVSVDTVGATMTLYIDGMLQTAKAFPGVLSSLDDTNNWLGRSQFAVDPAFSGSIDELRIYSVALSSPQVSLSFAEGPNPAFLE